MLNLFKKSTGPKEFEMILGDRKLSIKTGELAQQANGAVLVQYGETAILATCVISGSVRPDVNYFPLMVDYEEKLYAGGKIKGSRFIKREGKPSDESIIKARIIDRSIRPLFPQHIVNDIQVIIEVLSVDGENDADIVGLVGASAALAISDIPFNKIIGAVRIGRVNGELVLNPTFATREKSDLDLIVSASKEKTLMIEAQGHEVEEQDMFKAIEFAKKNIVSIIEFLEKVQKEVGKKKNEVPVPEIPAGLEDGVKSAMMDRLSKILYEGPTRVRKHEVYALCDTVACELSEKFGEDCKGLINAECHRFSEIFVRDNILNNDKRVGNRKMDEVRKLEGKVSMLPRVHGTGYFKRGGTQVLTITTLGAPSDKQIIEDAEEEYKKRYMHHYNFLPFSVGETSPLRGPSRRDIGHGMLAEKALEPLLPKEEDFPYTMRLVSEVYSSNGSSSMASVCGSSLSLMDAGVPIKEQVAGIAMGMASTDDNNYKILTDLQDLEDSEGGMDFKIAGTKNGITAIQLDTKTLGLTDSMVLDTLNQAKTARIQILDVMNKIIAQPRKDLSKYAPRIYTIHINPEKIRDVIGPGGKMINKIIEETSAEIDIEDDGTVFITSNDKAKAEKALAWVKDLTREIKVGEIFVGKVVRIMNFGAFVELFPGSDGLIHISKLAPYRVNKVEDIVKLGQTVKVKVLEIDSEGRTNLGLINENNKK
ncbi:MAG: polyribonucleotide nucleotidyltransferase [Patescibacteria group bacterium]|jgi:polyribonucleotide nucleotidyltransferase